MSRDAGFSGGIVPVGDYRRGLLYARDCGVSLGLMVAGAGLLFLAWYLRPGTAPAVRVGRIVGGDDGGGEELPPTMRERAIKPEGDPAALPN